ncbi:MAG: hypothetical protein U1E73_06115 [Planctomycetota bacterium]
MLPTSPGLPKGPRSIPIAFLSAAFLAVHAQAQVPTGTAVVGTSVNPGSAGTSGLYLVPLTGTAAVPIPVTGLPPALQVASGLGNFGVGTLDLRRADGAIVVGTVTQGTPAVPLPLEIYVLHLNGAAVAPGTVQFTLGMVHDVSGTFVAAMPDGRVLVAASDGNGFLANGPMAGHMFGILDLAGPTLTPLPNPAIVPTPGSIAGGLAVDPTGRYAYFTLTINAPSPARQLTLNRIDLTSGSYCVIASWSGQFAGGMSVDDDGTVYLSASDGNSIANFVHTVRPNGCSPAAVTTVQTSMPLGAIGASGMALDRADHRFLLPSGWAPGFAGPQLNTVSSVDPTTGVATVIASPPPGGWGVLTRQGIAVFDAIDSYGPCTDGQGHYWFDNFPNPGGQPVPGNLGFSLTLQSTAPLPVLSFLSLSFGRGALAVAGVQVLVDVGAASTTFLVPAAPLTFPMPIPAGLSLSGLLVTAQSFHLESSSAIAASAGLALRF